jgi:phosphatidylserine decarboxylase
MQGVRQMSEIQYYNRGKNQLEVEKVYGEGMVKFLYCNPSGQLLSNVFANKYISKAYGCLQDLRTTQMKVPKFVRKFNIDLSEYEPGSLSKNDQELSYRNFNEFFIRKFRPNKRAFKDDKNIMPAFSEARYFGYESVTDETTVPVKGKFLTAQGILGNKHGDTFKDGPLMIARLCPVDYHRYHYPDDGVTSDAYFMHGDYHSVNPLALKFKSDIFISNERRVSILETANFGKLAYVEVGAVMVGKIVQSFDEKTSFKRGDEKGYFLFGGSTVIVLGEKGKWSPSQDMLENTKKGIETYIQLGDEVARRSE